MIEQWGYVKKIMSQDEPLEVSFPITYINTPTLTITYTTTDVTARGNILSISNSQYKIMCGDHTTTGYMWMSIG